MKVLNFLKKYILNVLIGIDQLVNAIFLGDPDESISSRCGKGSTRFWKSMSKVVDFLFYKGHCRDSIELDEGKNSIIRE